MKLNLAILYEDLAEFHPLAKIKTSRMRCTLSFAAFPEEDVPLRADILYIVKSDELARMPRSYFNASPSVLCIGEPPESYLRSNVCNVIWLPACTSPNVVLTKVSERFRDYDRWYSGMQTALARDVPLSVLGQLSGEVFKKPIWMWDRHYETVFHVVDERFCTLPAHYVMHENGQPWPLWEVNAWKDGGLVDIDEVLSRHDPYILSSTDLFDYRALAYNLFNGSEYVATVTVDEVGSPITNRDYALIERLGSLLSQGLRRSKSFNPSASSHVTSGIKKLLDHQQVSRANMASILKTIGWEPTGPFTCIVAQPTNPLYSEDMLTVTAKKVCEALEGVVYVIDGHDIVFVVNLRIAKGTSLAIVESVVNGLRARKYQTAVGISTPFGNITDLYHYRKQAACALEIGEKARAAETGAAPATSVGEHLGAGGAPETSGAGKGGACDNRCYFFEDYMLDFIIDKCSTRVLPDTLCPPGLVSLMDYDREKNSDLCLTLRTYLESNMQVTETSRQLFMHRNTLINKLHKIDSILLADLSDPDVRLLLLIAFRILSARGVIDDDAACSNADAPS